MCSDKFPVKAKGIGRVFKAFLNSINGLRAALRHEQAFQQEVVIGVLCIIAIPFLQTSALESAILIVAVVLVWITELLNSGLEWTIDYISEEAHPYAKIAKDMGSAAVMISLIAAVAIWLIILIPYLN
ncbi:MAG TPA: diacylglycerol kinase [Opitutae bacterium]|nr:diacylglycerol kinase [Opitutae bacterium]|tara:strand:+ start:122 stop:505 length:384 start_codon:yes stop_codon:yes gene_type:complete